jgi:hypothetical protein
VISPAAKAGEVIEALLNFLQSSREFLGSRVSGRSTRQHVGEGGGVESVQYGVGDEPFHRIGHHGQASTPSMVGAGEAHIAPAVLTSAGVQAGAALAASQHPAEEVSLRDTASAGLSLRERGEDPAVVVLADDRLPHRRSDHGTPVSA